MLCTITYFPPRQTGVCCTPAMYRASKHFVTWVTKTDMFPLGVYNFGGQDYCSFILCCRGERIKMRIRRACHRRNALSPPGRRRPWGEGMMPNRTHSCGGSEPGGEALKGCLCGLSVQKGRWSGWPLRSCKEGRLPLRTMESEIKFGFLKDLPTRVW